MRPIPAAAVALLLLLLPGASQPPAERIARATNIPVEEWTAMAAGRTLTYRINGDFWALEHYYTGTNHVTLQLYDGSCMEGTWDYLRPALLLPLGRPGHILLPPRPPRRRDPDHRAAERRRHPDDPEHDRRNRRAADLRPGANQLTGTTPAAPGIGHWYLECSIVVAGDPTDCRQSSRWTRSLRSWRSWASNDSVAIGRASSRFSEIGSPVSSQ